MPAVRTLAAPLAALLWLAAAPAQDAKVELHPDARALLDRALAGTGEGIDADRLWQAAAAAHGSAVPMISALNEHLGADAGGARAARLLIGVLRYEGQPQSVVRVDRRIAASERTAADDLVRAEVLDTVGRRTEAITAYDALLKGDLPAALRQQVLFRRALIDQESAGALEQFARAAERSVDERNQAAIVLGLRDRSAEAIDLFEVRGESTERFRQLIRLAEWAMAAKDHAQAQQFAWEAVEVAKMRRDHRYALTVAVSAYRAGNALEDLLQRFEQASALSEDARQVWIDLLRDEGRVDDALRLFRQGGQGQWTAPLRRQLLEICRDTGREEVLVTTFGELIAAEPDNLEWRSGLSRHHLENGDRAGAESVWSDFISGPRSAQRRLDAAYAMRELGLGELARQAAERAGEDPRLRQQALLFVVGLHLSRGEFVPAAAVLDRIEAEALPRDAVHAEVAGYYERMNRIDRAVEVLDRLRSAHGGFLGTDLDMKFALLLSKVGREAEALEVWRALWVRMRNTPRGRYVEDRMMTVASRLGVLARIAIELEERLESGQVSTADVELLVRLYIKVGDSAAATEIIEEYLQRGSAADLEIIRRKANIYLACQDYVEYEEMIEQLVERDEENRIDHLRELLLSRLERGRRDQAIAQLPAIRAASGDDESADEFEAGVFQLSGLTDRALTSYVKSLGRHPDRIDTHLLVANLMRENGAEMQAARRFQYLASSADKDDLFTIAIDGILNLRAVGNMVPDEVVDWAMRMVLERLAAKPAKFYLYRLAADLAEEIGDMPLAIRTLIAGLPVAGERRAAVLRELLGKERQLDPRGRNLFGSARQMQISEDWDETQYVTLGRRLLGQGEIVPPQVYMDLATVFLKADAVADAMRTFSRAAELLDRGEVHRQAAQVLEGARRFDAALTFYRRLLAVETSDVGLLVKVGQLEELSGRDEAASATYRRGLEVALQQTALQIHVATEADSNDPMAWIYGKRNVDAVQAAIPQLVKGLLVTLERDAALQLVAALRTRVEADLQAIADVEGAGANAIDAFPRLQATADALRRLALCFRGLEVADAVDVELLRRFPRDRTFATEVVRYRADRGFQQAASTIVAATEFASDPALAWLAGGLEVGGGLVSPTAVAARILPLLASDPQRLRLLLESVDAGAITMANMDSVPLLLGACATVGAVEAAERLARSAVRADASLSDRERSLRGDPGMRAVRLAGRVTPGLQRILTQAIVDQAVGKGAQAVVRLSYRLPSKDDVQLDAETAERLLREVVSASGSTSFGMVQGMDLLRFVPAERRPALLRELHYQAPKSVRLSLLTNGGVQLEDPVSKPFVTWYANAYSDSLRQATDIQRNSARYAGGEMRSVDLDLARLRVFVAADSSAELRADLIRRLLGRDDRPAAIACLDEGLPDILAPSRIGSLARGGPTGPNKSHIMQLVRFLAGYDLIEPALQHIEAKLAKQPEHAAMLMFRGLLLRELPGAEERLVAALRRSPEDRDLLELTYEHHRERGHLVEAAELLERLAVGDEGKRWQSRLQSIRRQLGQLPPAGPPRPTGPPRITGSAGSVVSRASSVAVSVVRAATVARAVSFTSAVQGRPAPVVNEILKLEGEDEDEARRRFREHWRAFARSTRIVLPGMGPQVQASPATLAALADTAWIGGEVERLLRLHDNHGQLGGRGAVPMLLELAARGADPESRLRELAADLESGRGGNLEAGMMLQLLADEGVTSELRAEMVGRLERRIEMPDATGLRLLAREFARLGRDTEAARLYRLGVLCRVVDRYAARNQAAVEGEQLIAEVEQRLEGELARDTMVQLADDLLQTVELLSSGAGTMEALALQVWAKALPPEQAAERARALRHKIATSRNGRDYMNRYGKGADVAVGLAETFSRAGDFTAAVAEWGEFARVPHSQGRFSDMRTVTRRRLPQKQLQQFVSGGGERRGEWLRALGRASLEWHAAGELRDPAAVLGALGVAGATAEASELTAELAPVLRALGADETRALTELVKVERAMGQDTEALDIEVGLLAARRLPIADHARVVRAIGERDGAEAALTAGEKALAYTADTNLLQALVGLCAEAGQPERAEPWRKQLEARQATDKKDKVETPAARRG